jgi:hypothetical protein
MYLRIPFRARVTTKPEPLLSTANVIQRTVDDHARLAAFQKVRGSWHRLRGGT